jgi:hypothetical protein
MVIWNFFTSIWHKLWPFDNVVVVWYSFSFLVYCVKKNLATLPSLGQALHVREQKFVARTYLKFPYVRCAEFCCGAKTEKIDFR